MNMEKKIKVKAERNQKKEDNKCIQKIIVVLIVIILIKTPSAVRTTPSCGDFRVQLGDLIVECWSKSMDMVCYM